MNLEQLLTSVPAPQWRTRQAVVFDWYDGPREGVCALAEPACEFYFELLAERPTPDDLDDRLYRVSALPPGSVDELLTALADLGPLAAPLWSPVWRFSMPAEREKADRTVHDTRARRRPTDLVVYSRDMCEFLGYRLLPRDGVNGSANWFTRFETAD